MLGKIQDEIPPAGVHIWVDVRDLALAHVRAAERPEAAGKRFFVTAGYYSNRELADAIREFLPDVKIADKGGEFPEGSSSLLICSANLILELSLLFREVDLWVLGLTAETTEYFKFDNSRTKEILGIDFRSVKDMVKDTIPTLQAIGA